MEYNQLLSLLPPAIGISVLAYLTRFFGKIIADQAPFADDRKWLIEIAGAMFMINMASGLVGVVLATRWTWGVGHSWLHLITIIVLSFFGGSIFINNQFESARFFNFGKKNLDAFDKKTEGLTKAYSKLSNYVGIGILPIILFYFGTLEYLSGNIYWIIVSFLLIFQIFMWLAVSSSFRKYKEFVPVDIFFINADRKPLMGVRIIKVNDDNMRIRAENKIIILNKSEVLKIEMKIPENRL